jgi:hypothetical protein
VCNCNPALRCNMRPSGADSGICKSPGWRLLPACFSCIILASKTHKIPTTLVDNLRIQIHVTGYHMAVFFVMRASLALVPGVAPSARRRPLSDQEMGDGSATDPAHSN